MENLITGESTIHHATAIKTPEIESQPEVRFISEADFQGFTFTGISIEIPTPLVKTSSTGLFGINVDGFIPNFVINPRNSLWRNLFPVQPTETAINISGMEIYHEQIALPVMTNFVSHRYVEGDVGIAVRITSNTTQSGNLLIAQASGITRNFYAPNQNYTGLQFLNASSNPSDYAPNGFCVVDLSLNRHLAITPVRRCNTRVMDLAKKIQYITTIPNIKTPALYPFMNQFLEDWLLFGIQTTIPHDQANIVNLAFYFDWSRIKFYTPMLPYIPVLPLEDREEILLYLATNKNAVPPDATNAWKWWPKNFGSNTDFIKFKHYHLDLERKAPTGRVASRVDTLIKFRAEFEMPITTTTTTTTTNEPEVIDSESAAYNNHVRA